jgi:diguanylate cyclase (GGDEF)-like protein
VGVLMIDFDRFHLINDAMGQPVGDAVLRLAADRMQTVLRGRDVLARLTADRFAVQLTGSDNETKLLMVARNLQRAFEPACRVAGRDLVLSHSIGSATAAPALSAEDLLKAAEMALRSAKSTGGGGCRHFDPALMALHSLRLDMENRLRQVVQSGQLTPTFSLAYQPVVDAQTEHIVAVEALLRWHEAGRSPLAPVDFVPILEQTGLIVPVGRWVLEEACGQALKWRAQGARGLVLSVNVSPRQFAEPDFAVAVAALLARTGYPAQGLQLEVTEGLLLDPSAETLRKMQELVRCGVRLAVDDFGIGQSSLAYLKRFPLHTLKIDRLFVRDLHRPGHHHDRERAIARAIVELGHSLGLMVTAEGVESAEEAHTLQALGCDMLQGFRFGFPMPAGPMGQLLARRTPPQPSANTPSLDGSDSMPALQQAG